MQVKKMTDEEKIAMYKKLSKKELIRLLIERERTLDAVLSEKEVKYIPCQVEKPDEWWGKYHRQWYTFAS